MRKPFVFLWLMTGVTLVFFWIYLPVLSKYHDLKIQEEKTQREVALLTEKIKALQEERDLLRNDMNYLEKVIRDELGLVRPGEMIYKFVPEKEAAPSPEPSPSARVYDPTGMNYRS